MLTLPNTYGQMPSAKKNLRQQGILLTAIGIFYSSILIIVNKFDNIALSVAEIAMLCSVVVYGNNLDLCIMGEALRYVATLHAYQRCIVGSAFIPSLYIAMRNHNSIASLGRNVVIITTNDISSLKHATTIYVIAAVQQYNR